MDVWSKASRIYREEGMESLLSKAYQKYAPEPVRLRYGVKKTLKNPRMLRGHIEQRILFPVNKLYHQYMYENIGENFLEKDWDTLILLDACRYDHFSHVNWLPGELSSATSLGSNSADFLKRTFAENQYHDVVYVSANTYSASLLNNETLHDMIWLDEGRWDDNLHIVPPEEVTDAAIDAHERYPDKRLLVHYMQPHTPYIGERGRAFSEEHRLTDLRHPHNNRPEGHAALRQRVIDFQREEIVELYRENLALALESVARLLNEVDGKSVISADHGELLGETTYPVPIPFYGHPPLVMEKLRQVPWFVADYSERRETVSESPSESKEIDEDIIDERLKSLGYKS